MDYHEVLDKATADMCDAERRLMASGLPPEQWAAIKEYLSAAMLRFQLTYAKALAEAMGRNAEPNDDASAQSAGA
jgi:hypothetical protein